MYNALFFFDFLFNRIVPNLYISNAGLGTCWVCNFDVEKCRLYFPGDDGCEPVVLIPVGYPDGEVAEKKRKPMSDILSGIEEE